MIYKIIYPDPILLQRLFGFGDPDENDDNNGGRGWDNLVGKIIFTTGENFIDHLLEPTDLGFVISYVDQIIFYNGIDTYTFRPSNISIKFIGNGRDMKIHISGPNYYFMDELTRDVRGDIGAFKTFLNILITKQRGREMTSVLRVGKNRDLPPLVEGEIAKYLSGKNEALVEWQVNKLKQNAGISLAPRGVTTGGKRRTRKKNK